MEPRGAAEHVLRPTGPSARRLPLRRYSCKQAHHITGNSQTDVEMFWQNTIERQQATQMCSSPYERGKT